MLRGVRKPRPESLDSVCHELGFSVSWIRTGIGEPRLIRPAAPLIGVEAFLATQTQLEADAQNWLRLFKWLDPHVRYDDNVYEHALFIYRTMQKARLAAAIR